MTTKETIIQKIQEAIQSLEDTLPKHESIEWYSINNLKQFKDSIEHASTIMDVEKAGLVLSRFAVDSVKWDSKLMALMKEIEKTTGEYLRQHRRDP